MRSYDAATLTYLSSEPGVRAHTLVWIIAKDRSTGVATPLGLWTGDDHETITVGGSARNYYGAGTLMHVEPIIYQAGVTIRMQQLTFSPLAPEVAQVIRGYEPRLAAIEIHRALYSTTTGVLIAPPHQVFVGTIDDIMIETPAIGGSASVRITAASAARQLTRVLPQKKSDETQRLRSGDRFRRYADVTTEAEVFWGEKRAKVAAPPSSSGSPGGNSGSGGGSGGGPFYEHR